MLNLGLLLGKLAMSRNTELYARVFIALEDAMVVYAPEFTTPEQKREVWSRIRENGGMLGYFGGLRAELRDVALEEEYDEAELKIAFSEEFPDNYLKHMVDDCPCGDRDIKEVLYMAFSAGYNKHVSDDS